MCFKISIPFLLLLVRSFVFASSLTIARPNAITMSNGEGVGGGGGGGGANGQLANPSTGSSLYTLNDGNVRFASDDDLFNSQIEFLYRILANNNNNNNNRRFGKLDLPIERFRKFDPASADRSFIRFGRQPAANSWTRSLMSNSWPSLYTDSVWGSASKRPSPGELVKDTSFIRFGKRSDDQTQF